MGGVTGVPPRVPQNVEHRPSKPKEVGKAEGVRAGHALEHPPRIIRLPRTGTIDLSDPKMMRLRAKRAEGEADTYVRLAVSVDPTITVERRKFYLGVARDAVVRYQRQLNSLAHTDADRQRAEKQVGELRAHVNDLLAIIFSLKTEKGIMLSNKDVLWILQGDDALPSATTTAAQDQIDPPKVRRGLIDV